MMKAYLTGVTTQYEGEDIEVRYRIYEDEELISKKSIMIGYKKPAVVGQVALLTLLKELENHMDKEIVVVINDAALYEVVRGTSTTENRDVLNMARDTRKAWMKFKNAVILDVGGDRAALAKWNDVLQP